MAQTRDLAPPPPLAALARDERIALFLDFDGTLIDLAVAPDAIAVPRNLAERLASLSARVGGRLAVVTGRALEDLRGHLAVAGIACAGSHGADCVDAAGAALGDPIEHIPAEAIEALEAAAREAALGFERKPHGAALHYREHPEKQGVALRIAADVAARFGLEMLEGKCVVELVRADADKGSAVGAFLALEPFAGARPIFVGDDVTDEDGFVASTERGGFGVIVGDRAPTDAQFRLPDVAAVYQWLEL